ncbi:ABC transporter ATP-binding protein [Paraburkholderia agricolaris]|jgi:putative spermidine/putrescine transport system ATP-binding protein|uniref:ABC transporter ATP-binding protein n=1 Tax=Paraburkholderia agricolaris TaxID=2152888 RepID=A0ABW8ZL73_9BURK
MTFLQLEALHKRYGGTIAVHDVSLTVERGQFVSLLGPSGCGKTTTLQMIAGFVMPSAGAIRLDGRDLLAIKASARGLGIVFQSYALFPHMTVAQNVAFGLETRRVPRAERERRVAHALELVRLAALGDRYPAQLSGGQRQRVALARALVIEPPILLLDEPLSNLDAKLREDMQDELRRIQRRTGTTTIMVTHDQGEAMALSDCVAVMNGGRIEQAGTPLDVYEHPRTTFVATFLGKTNLIDGEAALSTDGTVLIRTHGQPLRTTQRGPVRGRLRASLRPEKITLLPDTADTETDPSTLTGTVAARTYGGDHWLYEIDTALGKLLVRSPHGEAPEGRFVGLHWQPDDLRLVTESSHA